MKGTSKGVKVTNIDSEKTVQIDEGGILNLDVIVPEDGYYNLELCFYPVISTTSAIKFKLTIDGELPFSGASSISLKRIWKENTKIEKDSQGNQIRSSSIESPRFITERVEDESGLALEPYKFFLTSGNHTVSLSVFQNILALKSLKFSVPKEYSTFF